MQRPRHQRSQVLLDSTYLSCTLGAHLMLGGWNIVELLLLQGKGKGNGRIQKGAGGTLTDQLPQVSQPEHREFSVNSNSKFHFFHFPRRKLLKAFAKCEVLSFAKVFEMASRKSTFAGPSCWLSTIDQ